MNDEITGPFDGIPVLQSDACPDDRVVFITADHLPVKFSRERAPIDLDLARELGGRIRIVGEIRNVTID